MLDLKILKIETASQTRPGSSDMKLIGIVEAAEFKAKVLQQRMILTDMKFNTNNSSEEDESILLLREIRDLLKKQNQ